MLPNGGGSLKQTGTDGIGGQLFPHHCTTHIYH